MRCPLCGGPLHVEDGALFVCERGHQIPAGRLHLTAGTRVTVALWMAIEALESEAEALRALATFGSGDGDGTLRLAEAAEDDARLLRQLAGKHVPMESDGEVAVGET